MFKPCPVLLYTSFKETRKANDNRVHIYDFEWDIISILKQGYRTYSLSQINKYRIANEPLPKNSICIVFCGGYEDNYRMAYPIIRKYGLFVDIFVSNELMGIHSLEGNAEFIPHFGWQEAKEMSDSGQVTIYPLWHPFDYGKDMLKTLINKTVDITNHLADTNPRIAFCVNAFQDKEQLKEIRKKAGIDQIITPITQVGKDDIINGFIPYDTVNDGQSALDVADYSNHRLGIILDGTDPNKFNRSFQPAFYSNYSCTLNEFLQIDNTPLIRCYLRHAFPLGVIQSERKGKAELLVLNDYIDAIFRPWDETFDFNNRHYIYWKSIDCCRLVKRVIDDNKIDIIRLIINNILLGYYADLNLDAFYIPGKRGYNSFHNTHCVLIYGFDNSKEVFFAQTYTEKFKYETIQIPYMKLKMACANSFFWGALFLRVNFESFERYDCHQLMRKLQRYLDSIPLLDDNSLYYDYNPNQYYGFNASEEYTRRIRPSGDVFQELSIMTLYSYLEHKKCMGWRMNYIAQREHIYEEQYGEYKKKLDVVSGKLLTLGLKYNASKKPKDRQTLYEQMETINVNEKQMIEMLISSL